MFEAVILAGGFGTRLKSITGTLPKPMANINGVPFIHLLMKDLESQGCSKIILSLHYNYQCIIDSVEANKPVNCLVEYSVEDHPLGTGGAIKLAASRIKERNFIVVNGDTFCALNYEELLQSADNYDFVISSVKVPDVTRYGALTISNNNSLLATREKGERGEGYINSGVYVVSTECILNHAEEVFSFESSILEKNLHNIGVFKVGGYFIDIGIPEDYYLACENLR